MQNCVPNKRQKMDDLENCRTYICDLIEKGLLKPGDWYQCKFPDIDKKVKPILKEYLMMDLIFWDLDVCVRNRGIALKLFCPECNSRLNLFHLARESAL